jgi:phage portal protein BeeE
MSLVKSLFQSKATKFTPAASEVNWTRIETLVHGPGVGDTAYSINSAVFACLMAIATSYPEPPLVVKRRYRSGDVQERLEHPLQALLDDPTPNGELSIEEILFWTAWAKHTDGNAYWLKVRSGNAETGNVIELWPISPTQMEPFTEPKSSNWIDYYKYRIRPNETVAVPVNNVIHFRLGIDDRTCAWGYPT